MAVHTHISAVSTYLPEKIITNHALENSLDTSDAWITQRTGIKQRHIAASDESSLTMALQCCQQLLTTHDISADQITAVLVATSTAGQLMPSLACQLCNHLGIANAYAIDINAACSGFLYALESAHHRIQQLKNQRILVVGVDTMSRVLDWKDRTTAVLFGDGAGAILLEASQVPGGLIDIQCQSAAYGASKLKIPSDYNKADSAKLTMQGRDVFRFAVSHLAESAQQIMQKNDFSANDIDWIIPHQANLRILHSVAERLQMPMDKIIQTVHCHANTSAASVPLALKYAVDQGKIQSGQHILLQAFGAGYTWGAALYQWV